MTAASGGEHAGCKSSGRIGGGGGGMNERVGSRMSPRLQTWVEMVTVEPSVLRGTVWVEQVRELGPMTRISDLLQSSLRKFCCIHG